MKKQKLLIPIGIICVVIVIFLGNISVIISKGMGISIGIYLETKNNIAMIIKNESPIQMLNRTNKKIFDNLENGDKILVIHTGIEESYPARTGVYGIIKLGNGTITDIPQKVMNTLTELEWIEKE